MLKSMNLWSSKSSTSALLLISAPLIAVLFQSGCSGATTAAPQPPPPPVTGQLSTNTSSINFGNVVLGSSKTATVNFTNSTNTSVTILAISVSGPGFSTSGVANGTILNPGQMATLNVTFTPSSTGNQSGSITVTSNAPNSSITVGLQAAGVPAGNHLATLSWNPGAAPSPVIGYFVYRGTSSGGPYTRLNAALDANQTYTDTMVAAGQLYYYVVTEVDSNNVESAYSTEVSATIPTP